MSRETAPAGEDRCWPCTVANTVVGVLVAGVPLAAALARGDLVPLVVASIWAVAVCSYTAYRLVALGYLPYAETIARRTGLHDRIGPGKRRD